MIPWTRRTRTQILSDGGDHSLRRGLQEHLPLPEIDSQSVLLILVPSAVIAYPFPSGLPRDANAQGRHAWRWLHH
jgi:hypothetical protein